MDATLLFDARFAAICAMLFSTAVVMTAEEPESVHVLFLNIWRRYLLYKVLSRMRSSRVSPDTFWEVDMTKFEP